MIEEQKEVNMDGEISSSSFTDVLIVGAGWSGLYAAKYAKAEGLGIRILEDREDLGGVWNYTESKDQITVMRDTISSTSRAVTEASDFEIPESAGNFMHQRDVFTYLKSYADHFDLTRNIWFNCRVQSVEKSKAKAQWEVQTTDGRCVRSRHLVICAGVHQTVREVAPPITSFGGQVYHARDFKHFDDLHLTADDHLVVYGGGETASDIIESLVEKPCKLTWAIRDGQHFFRKTPKRPDQAAGTYDRWDNALDAQTTLLHQTVSNFNKSKPGMRYACNFSGTGSVFTFQGHGIASWINPADWFHDFFNKNGHTLDHVWNGRVQAAPGIRSCEGRKVCFEDGTDAEATHIICCFGYVPDLQFLPDWARRTPTHLLYKLVFHPDDPTLSYIGYARPALFSVPFMAETQCMWASRVWAGKRSLSDSETMRSVGYHDYQNRRAFFPNYTNPNLVNPFFYVKELRGLMGSSIRAWKDWRVLRCLFVVPFTPLFIRVLAGQYAKDEIKRLERQCFPTIYVQPGRKKRSFLFIFVYGPLALIMIGIPRLLRLDNLFDKIARGRMARDGTSTSSSLERGRVTDSHPRRRFSFWTGAIDRMISAILRAPKGE